MYLRRLLSLAVLLILFATAGRLAAHGIGVSQVVNVISGPYMLSVWTDPDPLREDETHIVIAVMDPVTQAPLVEDLTVSVRMIRQEGEPSEVVATALSDNSANQLLYVVEFNDRVGSGNWEATVIVNGPEGEGSDVTFPLEITPARGFNWLWLGLVGLIGVVFGWLVLASRKPLSGTATRPSHAQETPSPRS